MAQPLTSPYVKGNLLTLKLQQLGSKQDALPPQLSAARVGGEVRARIVDVIEPPTLSVVVVVELLEPGQERGGLLPTSTPAAGPPATRVVLKVYDRQFSLGLREFKDKEGPATCKSEDQYRAFLRHPGAFSQFLADYAENGRFAYEEEEWDVPRREAYFHLATTEMHACELKVYNRLTDLQGLHVPTLFADVRLAPQESGLVAPQEDLGKGGESLLVENTELRAIMLEYTPGFLLSKLATEAPESDWAAICDQAMDAVRKIIDHDFINSDLLPRNTLVVRRDRHGDSGGGGVSDGEEDSSCNSPSCEYQVVYIDFAQCRFRDESETDEIWRETKNQRNEEAAIGWLLESHIAYAKGKKGKKYKGPLPLPWTYTPSNRYEGEYIELCPNPGSME
ncbi:hypothetical protein PG990_006868 [Apiospora arundinis]